ncbi:MAG TPA: DUF5666 domain-containing protein [Candidatus Paceibacterota bacterium]|nr:DUF5666 domain-containing protein [Candidatus Paceibacterota bacterium]
MKTHYKNLGTVAVVAALIVAPVYALAQSGNANKAFAPRSVGSTLEIMIADNGKTTVRGARVTDVSGSTITAQTMWDASSITWTVRTDGDTDFIQKNGSSSEMGDIQDGDYISFSGTLSSGSSFSVAADVVKNWSLAENRIAFTGTVTDVDDDRFTLSTTGRGNVTVRVTGDTEYASALDALGDIDVDSKVVAYGAYNSDTNVLTASSISLTAKAAVEKDNKFPKGNAWGFWKKIGAIFGNDR